MLLTPPSEQWCVANVDLLDDGHILAEAIRNKVAIAVGDGSFKETYQTAAWVLEGDTPAGSIIGHVISPGNGSDQSAYRSELPGIMSLKTCVHIIIWQNAL